MEVAVARFQPAGFLDTEAKMPAGEDEFWPQFECSDAGGVLVRPNPMFFAEGDGDTLEPQVFERVRAACEGSLPLLQSGTEEDLDAMMRLLYPAIGELPGEKLQWHAYGYIVAHIGEGYWRWGLRAEEEGAREELFGRSLQAFEDAIRSPGGFPNPWVHLRIGQLALELGDERRAVDELTRAYMAGAREFFQHEDPKYMALLDEVLKPPPGMDRLP